MTEIVEKSEKKTRTTIDLLEEYGIVEDKHAIEVARALELEGFTCPIMTREELVQWLDEDTIEFPSYDITKIYKELKHHKSEWTNTVIEKMTVEELRELRKKEIESSYTTEMSEKWKKELDLRRKIKTIFSPFAMVIGAENGCMPSTWDKTKMAHYLSYSDDHESSGVDLQPLIKEADRCLQEIGYKIISVQETDSSLHFTMHRLDTQLLSEDQLKYYQFLVNYPELIQEAE